MGKFREHWAAVVTARELDKLMKDIDELLVCSVDTADECIPDADDGFCACGITDEEVINSFLKVKRDLLTARLSVLNARLELKTKGLSEK